MIIMMMIETMADWFTQVHMLFEREIGNSTRDIKFLRNLKNQKNSRGKEGGFFLYIKS